MVNLTVRWCSQRWKHCVQRKIRSWHHSAHVHPLIRLDMKGVKNKLPTRRYGCHGKFRRGFAMALHRYVYALMHSSKSNNMHENNLDSPILRHYEKSVQLLCAKLKNNPSNDESVASNECSIIKIYTPTCLSKNRRGTSQNIVHWKINVIIQLNMGFS